jgi:hypothetical protein
MATVKGMGKQLEIGDGEEPSAANGSANFAQGLRNEFYSILKANGGGANVRCRAGIPIAKYRRPADQARSIATAAPAVPTRWTAATPAMLIEMFWIAASWSAVAPAKPLCRTAVPAGSAPARC